MNSITQLVSQQVFIMLVLIVLGAVLTKLKVITHNGTKEIASILLNIVTPALLIKAYQIDFDIKVLKDILTGFGLSVLIHIIYIVISKFMFFAIKDDYKRKVLKFTNIYSNAGFMGLPLQQAVLGEQGVFYGAAYVTAFNLTLWTYGLMTMDRSSKRISARKILINPGVIGLAAGVIILVLPVQLPPLIRTPISHLAALNTPLPMVFIGYSLSKVNLGKILRDKTYYLACAVRLLLVPTIVIGVLYLAGIRDVLLLSMAISASAPVAAAVSMFAGKYEQDTERAVNLVALSTVFSVITMPLFVSLVKLIA